MNRQHTALIAVAAIAALTAAPAAASNMAFLLEHDLDNSGTAIYWVSIPYHYQPPDVNSNGFVDAEDLGQDLQPSTFSRPCGGSGQDLCAIYQVRDYDVATGNYRVWRVGSTRRTPFELEVGKAYAIDVQAVNGTSSHRFRLAGAHDPAFDMQHCVTDGGLNIFPISLPAHLMVDDCCGSGGAPNGVMDAEDLAQAMGGTTWVYQVRQFDTTTGNYLVWRTGSTRRTPFTIDPTKGYFVDLVCPNSAGDCSVCTFSWSPPHF